MLSPALYKTCVILVLIVAIAKGIEGIANWNAVEWVSGIFGTESKANIAKILYIIMGIAGVVLAFDPRTFTY
jgi:uncharacterized membrane protein YuzA (DUF378 family)